MSEENIDTESVLNETVLLPEHVGLVKPIVFENMQENMLVKNK